MSKARRPVGRPADRDVPETLTVVPSSFTSVDECSLRLTVVVPAWLSVFSTLNVGQRKLGVVSDRPGGCRQKNVFGIFDGEGPGHVQRIAADAIGHGVDIQVERVLLGVGRERGVLAVAYIGRRWWRRIAAPGILGFIRSFVFFCCNNASVNYSLITLFCSIKAYY